MGAPLKPREVGRDESSPILLAGRRGGPSLVRVISSRAPRAAATLALLALAACRSSGPRFDAAGARSLAIGVTTSAELRARFGEPDARRDERTPELASIVQHYRFARGDAAGGEARSLAVELVEGRVRGWLFESSFDADSTDFDLEASAALEVGRTTREDALALLGPPAGAMELPSALARALLGERSAAGAREVLAWRHTRLRRELVLLRSSTRTLALAFDAEGLLVQLVRDPPPARSPG